jgi:eukaryotic-like serine/threonine-protein kinase
MTDNEPTAGAFAKYRPIAELGHGGMAQVFLALASGPAGFNKLVVIKQIREPFADDPEFLTMFLDEARLAARLNHPNVVQTNEVGGDGKRFYICMEYLEGQPLNRLFSRVGPERGLTLGMQLRILVDALAGLHHAHELADFDGRPLQVVHRDATPHNIFVTYAGQVKVVDFGIAKALSSSAETRTGVLKGKIAYMAPEQALGEKVDRRADVFAVGMILWEVLAGKRPFKGVPDVAILQKIVSGGIPSPRTLRADVPEALEAICMKALSHARDDRYATAADMAAELEKAIDELGEKGTVRDAGRLIEKLFASDRESIKRLVEAQAARNRAAGEDTFDPRTTGSNPRASRLPILDPGTVETTGATPAPGTGSTRIEERPSKPEPSHPSSLTASTAAPALAPPREGKGRVYAAIAAAAVGVIGVVAFLATRGGAPAVAPPPAPSAEAAPKGQTVVIDSTPQGASVREGDADLGKTPLPLKIDPSAPPRVLVLSLDGYAPHTVMALKDVAITLAPVAAPQAAAPAPEKTAQPDKGPRAAMRAPAPPPAQPPAPKPPAPSLDINTAR